MKKNYIIPELLIVKVSAHSMLLSGSNTIDGNSVNLNPNTMVGGDGGDAVKYQGNYVQWDDWGSDD